MREALIHKWNQSRVVRALTMHAWTQCGHLMDMDLLTPDWDKNRCKNCEATKPKGASNDSKAG